MQTRSPALKREGIKMKKGRFWVLLLCALAVALELSPVVTASPFTGSSGSGKAAESPATVAMISQTDGAHVRYMNGDDQGLFQPEKALTRGELAQILYGIVADRPAVRPVLQDVPGDAWYAPAAETVIGLGLMTDDYGMFRPGDPATRAECAYALSRLLPGDAPLVDVFPDVWPGYWAYQDICRTVAQGLFYGDGTGNFRPDDSLRRCEAAAVFNRLLGRSPDIGTLAAWDGLRTFPDVPGSHWAYGEIMEATVTHRYTVDGSGERWLPAEGEAPAVAVTPPPSEAAGRPNGPQRIDGHLYWVSDGTFIRNQNMGGFYFNENGWYTTGDEELDGMLNELVDRLTTESMSRDEKLRALYNYVRDNFTYLKRPLIETGQTGWHAEYAKYFLTNGKGNCYNFSATYCLLCQELGLPAYTVVGSVLNSPHGWVEIVLDGEVYMFDTQLEWRYLHQYKKTGYDLFKMSPSKTPFQYTRS